jgi:hypothetical protein
MYCRSLCLPNCNAEYKAYCPCRPLSVILPPFPEPSTVKANEVMKMLSCKDYVAWDCKTMEGDSKVDEELCGKCRLKPPLRVGNHFETAWPITH